MSIRAGVKYALIREYFYERGSNPALFKYFGGITIC